MGLYDGLRRLMTGGGTTEDITKVWKEESNGFSSHMLRFLENHDEQRIASKEFATDPRRAIPAMTVTATLGSGPVMLYFGQEVGEPARGAEGFSSADGRTTIFDYWGVPEHQKWLNQGKFDGGKLSPEQKKLRDFLQPPAERDQPAARPFAGAASTSCRTPTTWARSTTSAASTPTCATPTSSRCWW